MKEKVAISGASGLIGSKLAASLERRGCSVHRLVRSKPTEGSAEIYWDCETGEIDADRRDPVTTCASANIESCTPEFLSSSAVTDAMASLERGRAVEQADEADEAPSLRHEGWT